MAGKKAAAVPKKKAAAKKKKAAEEEDVEVEYDDDEEVDEVAGKMEKMTLSSKKNNPVKVFQIIHIGFSPDGEKRRILRVLIQGLAPGPRGVLSRLRDIKIQEHGLSFKVTADESELDAKEIFKEIYKKNPNHGAVTSLQALLD